MAQRNNKPKKNNAGIDVVNPEGMDAKQLDELDNKTNEEKEVLQQQLDHLNKQIRGKLWLWWLLPIFGWIAYSMIWNNRVQKEENQTKLILIKRAIAEKEIQLMLDKKQREQLDKKN